MTHLSRLCRQLSLIALAIGVNAFAQSNPTGQINMGFPVPQTLDTTITPNTVELHPKSVTLGPISTFGVPYVQNDLKLGREFSFAVSFSLNANVGAAAKRVPDGWYLMTFAVIYKDTSRIENWPAVTSPYQRLVTASVPALVQVLGGKPVTNPTIALRFDNMTAVAVQHELYFELLPIDNRCGTGPCVKVKPDGEPDYDRSDASRIMKGHRPYTVLMSVIPFQPKFSADTEVKTTPGFMQGQQTLVAFVRKALAWQLEQKVANRTRPLNPRQYADQAGLHYLDLNDKRLDRATSVTLKGNWDLRAWIRGVLAAKSNGTILLPKGYTKVLPALCQLLADQNANYPAGEQVDHVGLCRGLWKDQIFVTRVTHVGKVDRRPGRELQTYINAQFNYQTSLNFVQARSRSRDYSETWAIKPIGGASKVLDTLGVFNPLSAFDWSWSVSESNSRSTIHQALVTASDFMHFDPTGLIIPTVGTRKCLMVTAAPAAYPFFDRTPGVRNGLYICDETAREEAVREIYAHLFSYPQNTSALSAFDPGTQSVNQAFRGDRDLAQTLYQIRAGLKPVDGPEIFPSLPAAAVERYFNNSPSIYDMTVLNPVAFERDPIPSTSQMLLRNYRETFVGVDR